MTTMPSKYYTDGYYAELRNGSLRSAEAIVPLVLRFVPARSVVDVGCGQGAWLSVFRKLGVTDVHGVDGDYVDRTALLIPESQFQAADLSEPLRMERTFDLAMSVEVAEHLPAEAAAPFVESLTRLAPVVLFSAAIPLQGGTQHINEQWPEKWAALFKSHGYLAVDCIRKQVWQNGAVEWWYAQNTFLFVRADVLETNAALRSEFERTNPDQLSLVHPRNYVDALQPVQPPRWGVRTALRLFLLCLRNAIRKRVGGMLSEKPVQNPPDFNSVLCDGTSFEMVRRRNRGQNG